MSFVVPRKIDPIKIAETESADANGRLRVSNILTPMWEIKHVHGRQNFFFNDLTAGAGTISFDSNTGMVSYEVGTASGDKAISQTKRYFPVPPKRSVLISYSTRFGAKKAGVRRRIGYFDDNNGFFIEQDENDLYVVHRTNISGTPVDVRVAQGQWNVDTLDGNGLSGKTIDENFVQTFVMDVSIDSVPRIRFGVEIDGIINHFHFMSFEDVTSNVFRYLSLPLRHEIENTAATASASKLSEGMASLSIEGQPTLPELIFQKQNLSDRSVSSTRVPIFAIRLKNNFNGQDNRRSASLIRANFFSEFSFLAEVALVSNPSSMTATWQSAGDDSAVEYSEDISAITGNEIQIFSEWTAGDKVPNVSDLRVISENFTNFINQNFDSTNSDIYVVYATKILTGTEAIRASLGWVEFE